MDLLGLLLPIAPALPFVLLVLGVAVLPAVAPHAWEREGTRAAFSALLGAPPLIWALVARPAAALHSLQEYLSFILLLGSLSAAAAGIALRGSPPPGPLTNVLLLAAGGVLASCIGTTGAVMVLLPAALRCNQGRDRLAHLGVFFIFIVGNIGGMLTPLGDPPLFLGYLRGVPFVWTLQLWPVWLGSLAYLLALFWLVDRHRWRRDPPPPPARADALRLEGADVALLLALMVVAIAAGGAWGLPWGMSEAVMAGLAALAWRRTPAARRAYNHFSWAPLREVAILFAGIFAAMIPALELVSDRGADLAAGPAWRLFWATGLLSSVLDNAPTYLTLAAAAAAGLGLDGHHLGALAAHSDGARLLRAIALGAVMMGATTYLGNGPNLMVRAMASARGVAMPSFLGYLGWSAAVLLPLLAAVSFSTR